MATWSTRRKYGYFFIFVVALIAAIGLPSFFIFYRAPSCADGIQNQGERGIDCGGPCVRLCPADFAAPRVLWSYSVKIVPGVYNALAYVQNPNPNVKVDSLPYEFKLYDSQGLLVSSRQGVAHVPAGQKFAVFEGGIMTGNRVPVRTTFEFSGTPDWTPGQMLTKVRAENINLTEGESPRAEVSIKNDSPSDSFSNIDAFIILYDKTDNRVTFSKTLIESIGPGETQTLTYTWPEAFPTKIIRSEVLFVPHPNQ